MAEFTCRIRITCAKCGHVVCANPKHPEYERDVHEAMRVHKETHHG